MILVGFRSVVIETGVVVIGGLTGEGKVTSYEVLEGYDVGFTRKLLHLVY